jgi:threonylcarbamoyladenosine tRNA methylthiotransferase MtaB
MDEVLREVRTLTDGGCREVVLTGIETASWGRDLGLSLIDLLEEVDKVPNIGRVRLGSLDPSLIKPAFVERLARLTSLAPHFHLSMQSGSNKILALMKRKYNAEMALRGMELLRASLPNVQFTTDMILGFPHEGEAEFEETLEFIKKARFLMIHAFPYSSRRGTPAAEMDGQVPEAIRHERVRALSALQRDITATLLSEAIQDSPEVTVLFEDYENGFAFGHTDNFIEVRVPSPVSLHSVTAQVRLCDADQGSVIGELV